MRLHFKSPLVWPASVEPSRETETNQTPSNITLRAAITRLDSTLNELGATNCGLYSNMTTSRSSSILFDSKDIAEPENEPGVAVACHLHGKEYIFYADRYTAVVDNVLSVVRIIVSLIGMRTHHSRDVFNQWLKPFRHDWDKVVKRPCIVIPKRESARDYWTKWNWDRKWDGDGYGDPTSYQRPNDTSGFGDYTDAFFGKQKAKPQPIIYYDISTQQYFKSFDGEMFEVTDINEIMRNGWFVDPATKAAAAAGAGFGHGYEKEMDDHVAHRARERAQSKSTPPPVDAAAEALKKSMEEFNRKLNEHLRNEEKKRQQQEADLKKKAEQERRERQQRQEREEKQRQQSQAKAKPRRAEKRHWRVVLGFPTQGNPDAGPPPPLEELKKRWRQMAMDLHPDKGGTDEQMSELNVAYEEGQKAIRLWR